MQTKQCWVCGKNKPLSKFHKDSQGKYGRASMCKVCKKEYNAVYRTAHKEELVAYRDSRKEKAAEYDAAYRVTHKEDLAKYQAKYGVRYRATHKEEIAARDARYRVTHKEDIAKHQAKYQVKYRATHKEEVAAYAAAYAAAHKEERKADKHNRRVAGGYTITADDIRHIKEQAGGFCCWCNKPIKEGHGHIDHIQPVSRDGTNELSNLVYICDECNMQKHDKTVLEFMLHLNT